MTKNNWDGILPSTVPIPNHDLLELSSSSLWGTPPLSLFLLLLPLFQFFLFLSLQLVFLHMLLFQL